ncbi:MAG: lipoyl(octanoyl) transferase LipB [Opitutales bacterium]
MHPPSAPETNSTGALEVVDWGRTDYKKAFEWQKSRLELRRTGQAPDTLVFTEHDPVYTLGLRKGAERNIVRDAWGGTYQGIEVVKTNRGGDITYHGPGQIVGYPIISLNERRDLHAYLRDLESVLIHTLRSFGLSSAGRRKDKTGIWLEDRKICAIGVAVRTWVTYHGFALNLNPELAAFRGIIPCGITDGSVTSMERELGHSVPPSDVKKALEVEFRAIFGKNASPHG